MMKRLFSTALAVLLLLLAGCTAKPDTSNQSKPTDYYLTDTDLPLDDAARLQLKLKSPLGVAENLVDQVSGALQAQTDDLKEDTLTANVGTIQREVLYLMLFFIGLSMVFLWLVLRMQGRQAKRRLRNRCDRRRPPPDAHGHRQ